MKAILEFNLPEEAEEFETAHRASKYKANIEEFENWMRSQVKYGTLPPAEHAVYETIREKFYSFINDLE